MGDVTGTVGSAYTHWSDHNVSTGSIKSDTGVEVSVDMDEWSYPFVKIAIIQKYKNVYGELPSRNQKVYESENHTFVR